MTAQGSAPVEILNNAKEQEAWGAPMQSGAVRFVRACNAKMQFYSSNSEWEKKVIQPSTIGSILWD